MQKEEWICYSESTLMQGKMMSAVNAYTPFGAQVGPRVQFDGAFIGQNPARSLKAANVRKYRSIRSNKTAHPPTIACTAMCGPWC